MTRDFQRLSFDEVNANFRQNKLRNFPGRNKGKNRILPYAKPRISTDQQFGSDPKFFIAGNCYGRQIEHALHLAGYQITSRPTELNLPGSVLQQYNRYNVYHGDVATNEITWAIDPNAQPLDDAFVVVDDEWADMQLNFSFSHPKELAREYRKSFNATYERVKQSDVVIVTTGGIEVWYDQQTSLYLNSAPTKGMVEIYPDRFELHRFSLEHCETSLHRTVEVILENTEVSPIIFLTASPVYQPTVFNTDDSLIEQTYARACQRVAAERVSADYAQVEYLPGLEFADLSDRKFGFSNHSYNHTHPCMSTRLTAEMLERYQGKTPGQQMIHAIGHCEALILAEDFEAAVGVCEEAIGNDAMMSAELDILYVDALMGQFEGGKACDWIMKRLTDIKEEDRPKFVGRTWTPMRIYGSIEQIIAFLDAIRSWESDEVIAKAEAELSKLVESGVAEVGGNDRPFVQEIKSLFGAKEFDLVIERCSKLFASDCDPQAKSSLLPFLDKVYYLRGQGKMLSFLVTAVEEDDDILPQWKRKMMQVARGSKQLDLIERVLNLRAKLDDMNGLDNFFAHMENSREQLAQTPSQSVFSN